METNATALASHYGNRLRVRACGLVFRHDALLLLHHQLHTAAGIWLPPGGGIEWGETPQEALQREFREECGVEITVRHFMFLTELIEPPLHGIELYFAVDLPADATLQLGHDPEWKETKPILHELRWQTWPMLAQLPTESRPRWLVSGEVFEETCLKWAKS